MIAKNDAAGDNPEGMDYEVAYDEVRGMISVCMAADLWRKEPSEVAIDVLRLRGFKKPRLFGANSAN